MPVDLDLGALVKNWLEATPEDWGKLVLERNRVASILDELRSRGGPENLAIILPATDGLESFFPRHVKVSQAVYDALVEISKKLETSVEEEYRWYVLLRFGRRLETTEQFRYLASLRDAEPTEWMMALTSAAMSVNELNKRKQRASGWHRKH